MSQNGQAVKTTSYEYPLKDGGTVTKTRYDYADGSKSFKWPPGTTMAEVGLYNEDLLKRLSTGEPWVLVEGEKTADALTARGIVAVSLPGGSGQRDLSALDVLTGYAENPGHVSPDNDRVGLSLMERAHKHLARVHPRVRWVPPVSDEPGGDFANLLAVFGQDDDREAKEAVLSRFETSLDGPPGPTPAEAPSKVTLYTAKQLSEMELPPVREVVPGLYGVGHYLLSGAPKMGKSFLAMTLATALGSGTYALGKVKVDKRPVLYLSLEDGLRRTVLRLQQRLQEVEVMPEIDFAFAWPSLDEGGLDLISRWMRGHQDGVVFVDTGKRLRQGQEDTGRSFYESDYDFIAPLTDLVHECDTFMLTLWHDRKLGAEDFFDQVNSSRGLTAAVDGVSQLHRDRGSKEAKLSIGDRDTEDRAWKLRWDDLLLGWLLGESMDVAAAKADPKVRVLAALRELDCELGVEAVQVEKQLGDMALATVRNKLTELSKEGVVVNVKKGRWKIAPQDDGDE